MLAARNKRLDNIKPEPEWADASIRENSKVIGELAALLLPK